MQTFTTNDAPKVAARLPRHFAHRLFLSLPLMAIAGFCLFGFVATFEPMPRVEQWVLRSLFFGGGSGSVLAICWLWLGRSHAFRSEEPRHSLPLLEAGTGCGQQHPVVGARFRGELMKSGAKLEVAMRDGEPARRREQIVS